MGGHGWLTVVPSSLWTWWALSAHCSVSLPVGMVGTVSSLQCLPHCGRGGHCWLTAVVLSLWAWWALLAHCSGSLPVGVVGTVGSLQCLPPYGGTRVDAI